MRSPEHARALAQQPPRGRDNCWDHAAFARNKWLPAHGYIATAVLPSRMPDHGFADTDVVVPAKPQPKGGRHSYGGALAGAACVLAISKTTAISGVTAIKLDFPRDTAEALLDAFTRMPEFGDRIVEMPLGVLTDGRLLLLSGGDLSARMNGAEWLSPEGQIGRLVFYGTSDLVAVDGPSGYQRVTSGMFFKQHSGIGVNNIEWLSEATALILLGGGLLPLACRRVLDAILNLQRLLA